MKGKYPHYLQVVTSTSGDTAEMFLYGYIGQEKWWEDDPTIPLTDLVVVQKLRELEKSYQRINIRINSPGGSVFHGDAIITAIQNCTAEVHTYNDGLAGSMAFNIWLAASNRHMAKNAKAMDHNVIAGAWGHAKALRSVADMLDKYDASAIGMIADATGMSEDEVKEKFFDYEDHWMTYNDVLEMGILTDPTAYEAETDIPADVEQMTYQEIMMLFQQTDDKKGQGYLASLRKRIFGNDRQAISQPQPPSEMNIEELRQSIAKGELTPAQLAAELEQHDYEVTQRTPAPADTGNDEVLNTLTTLVNTLTTEVQNLRAEVKELGDKPGAEPTPPGADADPAASGDGNTEMATYKDQCQESATLAGEGRNPFTTARN